MSQFFANVGAAISVLLSFFIAPTPVATPIDGTPMPTRVVQQDINAVPMGWPLDPDRVSTKPVETKRIASEPAPQKPSSQSELVVTPQSGVAPLIVELKWFKDADETAYVDAGDGMQGFILKALKRLEDGRVCITSAYLSREPSRCILVTTANTPVFTYRVPGTYTVTVKDKFGGTVLETKTITVR